MDLILSRREHLPLVLLNWTGSGLFLRELHRLASYKGDILRAAAFGEGQPFEPAQNPQKIWVTNKNDSMRGGGGKTILQEGLQDAFVRIEDAYKPIWI